MPGKITLVRKDGTRTQATPEEAKRLAIFGYRPETPEEAIERVADQHTNEYYDTAGQKALTALEGVASGATLGIADPLMADEDTRERAYRNPGYRIGGELVGAVAPAILSAGATAPESAAVSGAKVAGTLARALPAGRVSSVALGAGEAVGGVRGAMVAGAIEGAAAGAGSALTEASLAGDPLTAEAVVAHAGAGTILGMGVGAAAESLIGIGRARRGAEEVAEGFSPAARESDELSGFYRSLPAEKTPKIDRTPEWIKADKATADDELVTRFTENVPEYAARKSWRVATDESYTSLRGEINDAVKSVTEVNKDLDGALAKANADAKEYRRLMESHAADLRAEVGAVRRETADTLARSPGERKAIEAEFIPLEDGYKALQSALKTADPVKAQSLVERYKAAIRSNPYFAGARGAALPGIPDPKVALRTRDALKAADTAVQLRRAGLELSEFPMTQEAFLKMTQKKAERLFAAVDSLPDNFRITALDRALEDAGIKVTGSNGTKLRALYELRSGIPKSGVQRAYLNEMNPIEQTGTRDVTRAKFKLPEPEGVADTRQYVDTRGEPAISKPEWPEIADTPGEVAGPFAQTSTKGRPFSRVSSMWHRIGRLATSRFSSQAARKAGLGIAGSAVAYELGGAAMGALFGGSFISGIAGVKGSIVGRIAGAAAKYAPAVGKAGKRLAPRIEPLAVRIDGTLDQERDKREQFKARAEEITRNAATYRDAVFKAVEPLIGEHPEFAKSITDSYSTAYAGLLQFLPRDPGQAFSRLKSLWNPTDVQIAQFQKAYAVFHDPMGTIEAVMETGSVDATTVAALKTMYPSLYGELQMQMVNRLTDPAFMQSLTYGDQARLSILLDIPLHSSFTPRSIAQTQAMYRKPRPEEIQQGGSGGGNGGRPAKTEPPTAGQSLIQR